MAARFCPFQRLAVWTTGVTYLLILVGGLVRASGAGLGCPDWPRCFGGWIPPASAADLPPGFDPAQFNAALMWTEYLNRLLGVTVGLLILATVVSAWRHHRGERHILWTSIAALLLTGFQGWLGGQVVAAELAPWIVTVHMLVALVIVSLLVYATMCATYFPDRGGQPVWGPVPDWRLWLVLASAAAVVITLVQIALGTQVRGLVDLALDQGVARDVALETVGRVDRWHRDGAIAAFVALLAVFQATQYRHGSEGPLRRWEGIAFGLAILQIGLGLTMAYVGLIPVVQVLHLTLASLLLGALTIILLLAVWHRPE